MSSEKIKLIECPVCGRKDFKNVAILIAHIAQHNKLDPEVGKSVVAEQEKHLDRLLGG